MSSGFNTDVNHQGQVFHIQTEDRGSSYKVIDTALYQNGRVLLRKSLSYAEFAASPEFTPEWLRSRVAEHHRLIVEDLRAGLLDEEIGAAQVEALKAGGLQVHLANPTSWLAGGTVSLEVEVSRKADHATLSGASVEARIEGALQDVHFNAMSDENGRARIEFPLPPLGKGELALVILARAEEGADEIRFTMRSKPKNAPAPVASGS
jgi:hypothetical protein